jgi:hypothetical protein
MMTCLAFLHEGEAVQAASFAVSTRNADAWKATLACVVAIALGIVPPPPRVSVPSTSSPLTQPGDRATMPKAGGSPSIAKLLLVMLSLMAVIGDTGVQLYHHEDREPREDAHHGPRTVC